MGAGGGSKSDRRYSVTSPAQRSEGEIRAANVASDSMDDISIGEVRY